jgi:hypothetical protein
LEVKGQHLIPWLRVQLELGNSKMEKQEEGVSGPIRKGVETLVGKLLEALRQHDATGCAALFTEDGSILSPYGPTLHTDRPSSKHTRRCNRQRAAMRYTAAGLDG